MKNRRRVVVTGIGLVTPLGCGVEENWSALTAGRSGIRRIENFDASGFPTRIGGEIRGFNDEKMIGRNCDDEYYGKHTRFGLAAARMAYKDSGLDNASCDPERISVYLGCDEGVANFDWMAQRIAESLKDGEIDMAVLSAGCMETLNAKEDMEYEPNKPVYHIANEYNAQGPSCCCLTACAASAQAIGEAACLVRRGDADVVFAGGAHSMLYPIGLAGFGLLTAISTRNDEPEKASRPFDLKRDGFVLSEGGGILILEEEGHARRRGADIYGELLGYGCSADAYRITDTHPEGRGASQAMRNALNDAGLPPEKIDYINAHGTSTPVNDRVETLAIKNVFGDYSGKVPISSSKSMLGHLIAAAGGVEASICLLTIKHGAITPTINYEFPDPDCNLDYVPNEAREARVDIALSNSFGFGGQNVCLVLGRYKG